MAYLTKGNYGYGDGLNGDIVNPTGQLNSYANVTAYTANSITIGTASNGIYEKFAADSEIMIHVSATNGTSQEYAYLGKYIIAKIKAVSGTVLTIDSDFTAVLPAVEFTKYQVQVITICKAKNLTLETTAITPPQYSVANKYGGILLAKCTDTIKFSGGTISLLDKGIPVANTAYRPKTAQELQGTADTDKYSGWENHITIRDFLLNAGDGAVMLWAKHFVQTGTTSRIGGITAGVQFTRGTVGGSTIGLIAGDMSGFDPSIISKTKGSGQGLGRCYIASETKLRNDEGLYAYDCISDPSRIMKQLAIKNYGNGSLGDVTNPTAAVNNYAKVTGISTDGKTITYSNKTTNGMAQMGQGSTVLFHVSKYADSADMALLGKFMQAKVLADDGTTIILDTAVTKVFDVSKLSKYSCQFISLAQFNTLTLSNNYSATTAWNDSTQTGGICAIAVKDKCDISGGGIILTGKGGGKGAEINDAYSYFGNTQNTDRMCIGSNGGALFLISKFLTGNKNSRLGNTWDGSLFAGNGGAGGRGGNYYYSTGANGSGGGLGGYAGAPGGNGGAGGNSGHTGGYGGASVKRPFSSITNCSIFIIADTIDGLTIAAFSTGGAGGAGGTGGDYHDGQDSKYNPGIAGSAGSVSGCGYAGGSGGGGGSGSTWDGPAGSAGAQGQIPGMCFIYCNNIQNTTNEGVIV